MAVELRTESSSIAISPRISFSHDLNQSDIVLIEPHNPFKFDSDFDFCVSKQTSDHESSTADEIFANGVILPIQMKKKHQPMMSKSSNSLPPLPPSSVSTLVETGDVQETEEKQSKSFWKFERSKSLNCGSICRRSFCPFPLLSRSKSTGSSSSSSSKRSLISKDDNNQDNNGGLKNSCQKSLYSSYNHKHPLKKNYGVVHVSPVLNVSTANFLGLGSIFSNGKDKGKKK